VCLPLFSRPYEDRHSAQVQSGIDRTCLGFGPLPPLYDNSMNPLYRGNEEFDTWVREVYLAESRTDSSHNIITQDNSNNIINQDNSNNINPIDSSNNIDVRGGGYGWADYGNNLIRAASIDSSHNIITQDISGLDIPNTTSPFRILSGLNPGPPSWLSSSQQQYRSNNPLLSQQNYPTPAMDFGSSVTLDLSPFQRRLAEGQRLRGMGTALSSSRYNHILRASMRDNSIYKKVLSETGESDLKLVKYELGKYSNDRCSIMHINFEEGDEITQLPCKHCFNTEAINRWLKEEKAECPICRQELNNKEVKIETENTVLNTSANIDASANIDDENAIIDSRQRLLDALSMLYLI